MVELPWSNPNKIFLNGFARMKIRFLANKSVFAGKFIPINGKKEWVYLRFEDLPLLCYGCGKWGHDQRECNREVVWVKDGFWDKGATLWTMAKK